MKFKIIRSKFIEAIKSVQNIVGSKSQLAILQNVLLEGEGDRLRLTTSDLEMSIVSGVGCEIVEKGSTTLPVKLLFGLVAKAPEGEVTIDVDSEDHATIKAGSCRFKLNGKSAAEFPKIEQAENIREYAMGCNVLKEMLRKTAYAASQDDTRRTLKGVLMSFRDAKLTMVATDGRRLALVEEQMEIARENESDIVLPSKTVQELQRSLSGEGDVSIRVTSARICFESAGVQIYSKLIEDVYPNYRQVIPSECENTISIDRQLLLDALERASVMTMDEAHSTKLIFDLNKLVVTSAANDVGEALDEVPIKYEGEQIEIMFNPNYVMDPLRAIDDDEITFHINNGHSPVIIRCSVPFLYVLMPLRTN